MAHTIRLSPVDQLPLTCSRSGTCCHGKMVWLNPWELACLANAKKMSPQDFRHKFCESGGIRLKFDGSTTWKGLKACSQYVPDFGCSVHLGRPLACRLYPLGRELQGSDLRYIHQGQKFPCLEDCPEVLNLPQLSVSEYIVGQELDQGEIAQDHYLEFMRELADGAFVLLLERGLVQSDDRITLQRWRALGQASADALAQELKGPWLDLLMVPDIQGEGELSHSADFIRIHRAKFQGHAQERFGALAEAQALSEASSLMMGLALHLGRSVGANPARLAERWIDTAKENGALE